MSKHIHWPARGWILWRLALLILLIGIFDKWLQIQGWIDSNFNFISYHPALPYIGLVGASFYSCYIYMKYGHPLQYFVIWMPAISWFIIEILHIIFRTML